MKKLVLAAVCLYALMPLSAQEADLGTGSSIEGESSDAFAAFDDFDDLDDVFANAEDVEAVITTETPATKAAFGATVQVSDIAIPLKLTGSLSSSLGVGQVREDGNVKNSGYFDFYNYLYLYARPDKYMTVRASIATSYPNAAEKQLQPVAFRELYMDYLLYNHLYITAGKKGTTWGYPRLFTTSFDLSKSEEKFVGISTNILSDSIDGTSVLLRLPLWTGTISAIALYQGSDANMNMKDMSYAGSIEMTLFRTSINVFGRKNPSDISETTDVFTSGGVTYNSPHQLGIEIKRTIFGADVYAQDISQFKSVRNLKNALKDKNTFEQHLITAGLYNWWDKHDPNVGFNVEFQQEYVPLSNNVYRRVYVDAGLKRLGPKKNIKLGVSWNHQFTDNIGYVKPGIIIANIFPHCDWDTGVKVQYGTSDDYVSPKITLGTYLKLTLDY